MVRETSQAEVVLAANHIKTYNPIAYAATEPAPVALDASATANCYVVARAGRYEFDATTMGNGAVTPPDAVFFAENIIFPAGEIPFHYSPRPPEYVREYAAQIRK